MTAVDSQQGGWSFLNPQYFYFVFWGGGGGGGAEVKLEYFNIQGQLVALSPFGSV